MNEVSDLVAVIKERDIRQENELSEMKLAITSMSDNFAMFYKHVAVVDEERKHDAEFKKEVRVFMKESIPVILKAKDNQEVRGKLLIAAGSFIMIGILAFFFKF